MQAVFRYVRELDALISYRLTTKGKYKILDRLMQTITYLGDGIVIILFPLLLIIFGDYSTQRTGFACLIALFLSSMVTCGLKEMFGRPRPIAAYFGQVPKRFFFNEYAFPSGHTAASFTVATFYSFVFPEATLFFFFVAFCVGFSRIYLGQHYPSDVLTGIIIGIVTSLLVYNVI